jgi:hypothetical protein
LTAAIVGIGNDRKAQQQRLVVLLDRRAEIDAFAARRHRAIGEILSGAKAASGTGQDQATHARRGGHLIECRTDFAVHRDREAVQPVGPVQCQRCHAVGHVEPDRLERGCHRGLLERTFRAPSNSLTGRSMNSSFPASPLTSVAPLRARAPVTIAGVSRTPPQELPWRTPFSTSTARRSTAR